MVKRAVALILTALIAVAIWAFVAYGKPRTLAGVSGTVRDLTPAPEGLYWIEAPAQIGKGQASVRLLPRGRRSEPETVLSAYDVRSLVIQGRTLYALIETGPGPGAGQLVRCARGGAPEVLLDKLSSPQGLVVTAAALCWTEARQAAIPGIAHVPVVGPLTAVRSCPLQGGKPVTNPAPRLLGVIESAGGHYTGQLMGCRKGRFYWTERMAELMPAGKTLLRCAAERGGEPETVGSARGSQTAALADSYLFWTDVSDELATPASGRTVWRRPLAGDQAQKLTDWLPPSGALATDADHVFYAGDGRLWGIPGQLGWPRVLRKWGAITPTALSVCGGLAEGVSGGADGQQIVRQVLWPRGYLTATVPGLAAVAAGRRGADR